MKNINLFDVILWLIVFSVTSSVLFFVWPVIFVVGGIFLLLVIWVLVDKWLNPKKHTSDHINKSSSPTKNIKKPVAPIKKITPEFVAFMEVDSIELTKNLHNAGITTVTELAGVSTDKLVSINNINVLDAENIIISAVQYLDTSDDSLRLLVVDRYKDESEIDEIISIIVSKRATIKFLLNEPTDTRMVVISSYLQEIDVLIDKACELINVTPGKFFQMIISKESNSKYNPDDDLFFDDITSFNYIFPKEHHDINRY